MHKTLALSTAIERAPMFIEPLMLRFEGVGIRQLLEAYRTHQASFNYYYDNKILK